MYLFLAVACFVLAHWADGKITKWWWIPLGVGVIGSMLLYASAASTTVQGWLEVPIGWLGDIVSGVFGEQLPTVVVYGVLAAGLLLITIADLVKDHSYNSRARMALVGAPILAHGAGGWVGATIATIHGSGAEAAMNLVDGMFG